jgi:hypothetical protein
MQYSKSLATSSAQPIQYQHQISTNSLIFGGFVVMIFIFMLCLAIAYKFIQDNFNRKLAELENKHNENIKLINTQLQTLTYNHDEDIDTISARLNTLSTNNGSQSKYINKDIQTINTQLQTLSTNNSSQIACISEDIKTINTQCQRFDAFLDNYAIKGSNGGHEFSHFRLSGKTINLNYRNTTIECNVLRTLSAMGTQLNFVQETYTSRSVLMEHLNQLTCRNVSIEINLIHDKYMSMGVGGSFHEPVPLYMMTLLFGAKITTYYGEDVTDLFEDNFNAVKRYHDVMAASNSESKKISDRCNVSFVREMFK